MSQVNVRRATVEHLETCHSIETLCFAPSEAASLEKIKKRFEMFPEGFLVIERKGEVIGFANSAATDDPDLSKEELKDMVGHTPKGENMILFSMAIHPDAQGQGFSRTLMEQYLESSRRLGKSKVLLLSKDYLVDYYRHFGFTDQGVSSLNYGGFVLHEMQYVLGYDT